MRRTRLKENNKIEIRKKDSMPSVVKVIVFLFYAVIIAFIFYIFGDGGAL
ncbi:hypothetical protein [Clostridium perfringens]|nr:hypothetical protein [Clostridium perfringens]